MEHTRLNAYKIMWLFVFFDLPVTTKKERKLATRFRKDLMKDGFTMMQWSVYTRHCASGESADVHEKRIRGCVPDKGQITILRITDKQYSNMVNIWGAQIRPSEEAPQQLELF
ncbi:CRISPR-associated endonuclease Cas2 [Carboxylicivirga sediminis]|uniref:CRISPR-associated endoribonuclease Cas2 n=1 Tax=Carboxylicivirga sediminis TaxID=2006564 RepID=A0A941F2D2_9BACT|nr:CRISPR-associated endonuclease Cas2 [Carboxylicivirga sediminis]MBR8535466.1 CRISPR-associated endonuclease Cas2 [Carboxylicivirga sediminis]